MDYNDSMPLTGALATDPALDAGTPESGLARFATIEEMVKIERPAQSVRCMHPEALDRAARAFLTGFPGDTLYAIKANPDPYVLQRLYAAGIRHFDVASLGEVRQVRQMFPDAHLAFMNPVKSREAIRAAYSDYGVRDFVIDTFEELHKILEETEVAADLCIVVRLGMPKGSAACELTGKFGCLPDVAVSLLKDADKVAHKVGLSFHVGSQTLDPQSYATAIQKAGEVIKAAGVALDVFDVGGGFPIQHLGMDIPPLTAYFEAIRQETAKLRLPKACRLWAEPGRALSGDSETLLVRVELRKGDVLYINDGSFGNMFEVCSMNWQNTVHLIRPARKGRRAAGKNLAPFRFYGPTCDSVDYMAGPFLLPDDICEGDWIAIRGMGSYMAASQSHFNGFYSDRQVEIAAPSPSAARRRAQRSASHLKLVKSDRA
ncbi:MAG TPA: type III PLP-dependent enzyme, partial [Alphaproteobacteria bacterium]|nr:type III PLP-dependent enzyme [Alphaproteobacteria bacterium]